jgi:hypothetical protein
MSDHDPRIDLELLADVFEVLERHGYTRPIANKDRWTAYGRVLGALPALTRAYEGRD